MHDSALVYVKSKLKAMPIDDVRDKVGKHHFLDRKLGNIPFHDIVKNDFNRPRSLGTLYASFENSIS